MKIKQVAFLLISLLVCANCQGASKSDYLSPATLTAAMPANVIAEVLADSKAALDVSSKSGGSAGCAAVACANGKDTKQKSFDLQTQKAVLRSSLPKDMPKELCGIVQEFLYERFYKCVDTLKGHTESVNCIRQLADGRLASCSTDRTICIWAINAHGKYERIDILKGLTSYVYSIIQLADGRLASCSADNTIRIWAINAHGKYECADTLEEHTYYVESIIQLADGRLASCSRDKTIRIWDLSKKQGNKCVAVLEGHTYSIKSIMQLTDGRLASCSLDATIRIWDLSKNKGNDPNKDQRCVQILKCPKEVSISIQLADGKLASGSWSNGTIHIWAINAHGKYERVDILTGHKSCIKSMIQLADGRLASSSYDGTIRIWDLNKPKGNDRKNDQRCVEVLEGHTYSFESLIQLADGRLASGSYDNTISIWDKTGDEDPSRLDLLP